MFMAIACIFQSCAIVYVGDPRKKKNDTNEDTGTERSGADLTYWQVNPSNGADKIDASGCLRSAYRAAINAPFLFAKYGAGDKEWQEANDAWLNADNNEPYPEDLKDHDGCGFMDGQNAALNPILS